MTKNTAAKHRVLSLALAVTLPLMACAQQQNPAPAGPAGSMVRAGAGAMVKFVTPQGQPAGQAVLSAIPDGVEMMLDVTGLVPGLHGFHVHTNGQCGPGPDAATGQTVAFGAAGGHFDPEAAGRHGHPDDDAKKGHAGDAPNLSADAAGNATLRYTTTKITVVPGKASVMGRTLVVHANPDDYKTDPSGNSGGRVLCGVIEPARMDAVVGTAPVSGAVR